MSHEPLSHGVEPSTVDSNLLDSIIQSSNDGIASKNLEGIVTSWNPAAEKIFGYSAEEMIGQPMLKIFPDDRRHEEEVILKKIAKGEKVSHYKTQRRHKSGHLVDVSVSISPILNSAGLIVGASKIVRDISAEVSNEILNKKFRAIIESSDDAIISKDLNGIIQSWNNGAEKVFGYTAEEMIGEPMLKVFPDDRLHEESEILAKLKRGEKVDHFRTQRKRKDGKLIHVSATISPIYDEQGRVIGASKIARDISSQVEVERLTREFDSIIKSSHDAIISQTLDGTILSWNPAAEQLFGFTAREIIGESIFKIIPPEKHDAHKALLRSLLKGTKVVNHSSLCMRKDGEIIQVSETISPVYDSDTSTVIGASKIARDTTVEALERAEIWKQANFDSLTGLVNRSYFLNRSTEIIKTAEILGAKSKFYIAFLDVDSFKQYNDKYGHKFGDDVLKTISMVLTENFRSSDIVSRFAGDEFVLLLKDDFNHLNVNEFFNSLIKKINQPVIIDGTELSISVSIGIACFPDDGNTIEAILEIADKSMYAAKNTGKNQFRIASII